jgi:hypothetical protein
MNRKTRRILLDISISKPKTRMVILSGTKKRSDEIFKEITEFLKDFIPCKIFYAKKEIHLQDGRVIDFINYERQKGIIGKEFNCFFEESAEITPEMLSRLREAKNETL